MKIAQRTEFLPVRLDPPWCILYQHQRGKFVGAQHVLSLPLDPVVITLLRDCGLPQFRRGLRRDVHACARVPGRLRSSPRQQFDLVADELLGRLHGQHAFEVLLRTSEHRPASREIQA
ncbi:MAG TPA: hypothetical protein VJU59_49135 [Paraburkholderia sp.]|nr:hypothetical protein [Paraburkholderia sp.]HKR47553.1 hypothetical protein [Paraburkholderia sp.]